MTVDYDIIIIGGGATGLGCAVEAASRGYRTLVVEAYDYGQGTSTKSTKLVHGGIRYLANFDFHLVQEGLAERYYFLNNAPHLAQRQSYLIPLANPWQHLKFSLGIRLYDWLAGAQKLGPSEFLSKLQTLTAAPQLNPTKVMAGAVYYDGQFDDARMLITLVRTLEQLGGTALNYHKVVAFSYSSSGKIDGVKVVNQLNQVQVDFKAKAIINACGTFSDRLKDLAEPGQLHTTVTVAQGTHLVFDKNVFNSKHAILVPHTSDGRVLFILPWHNKVVVGTTDIQVEAPSLEPQAQNQEVEFILHTLNEYIQRPVSRADIRALFCGQRPLVRPSKAEDSSTISRKHQISQTTSGLITIVGGKWTIYRRMGQDCIDYLENSRSWPATTSTTHQLRLFGYTTQSESYPLSVYGNAAVVIHHLQTLPGLEQLLHPRLPYTYAEVVYHARYEHAKTVADVLARRTRALFLDAAAAIAAAPGVARILAHELRLNSEWEQQQLTEFNTYAQLFLPVPN